MIRNENEYQEALRRIEANRATQSRQRAALESKGFTPEQIEQGMAPLVTFHLQLQEEVHWYQRVRDGNIDPLSNLTNIGLLLIGLRIASGITQRELAERLRVSEAQVSRDERNEYHGITIDRAQRVLEAIGAHVEIRVTDIASAVASAKPRELVEI